ncbi:MAG: hypothetical protein ABTQ32_22080 [Myxococcaceae bacterium]
MLEKLPAALVAALFFGGLPVFWLSNLEGPVTFSCGGTPWRCDVSRWVFFSTKTASSEPVRIGVESARRGKRISTDWRIVFTLPSGTPSSPTDWGTEGDSELANRLEAARSRGEAIVVERPPGAVFWLAVILSVVFIAAGLFVVLGRSDPASIARGRPDA